MVANTIKHQLYNKRLTDLCLVAILSPRFDFLEFVGEICFDSEFFLAALQQRLQLSLARLFMGYVVFARRWISLLQIKKSVSVA